MRVNNEHIQLRRRMERLLGQPVSAAAWTLAEKRRYVADALDPAEDGEAELVEFLRDVLNVVERSPVRSPNLAVRGAPALDSEYLVARIEAVSRLAAQHAAGDEEILAFRHRVLGRDTPMSAAEAEAYLDEPEARQSPRTNGPIGLLQYQNRHVFHDVHVWPGSPLDELRKLASTLVQSYPWQPPQAAAFVLEGLRPLATPFALHFPQSWHETRPRRAKVVLEVDLWMPAAAVLRAYRDLQRKVLPGHNRPVSRRSIDLVNFVLRNRPATWPELLKSWNKEHPSVAYSDYRHLRYAFQRAQQSLLSPAYRPYFGPAG